MDAIYGRSRYGGGNYDDEEDDDEEECVSYGRGTSGYPPTKKATDTQAADDAFQLYGGPDEITNNVKELISAYRNRLSGDPDAQAKLEASFRAGQSFQYGMSTGAIAKLDDRKIGAIIELLKPERPGDATYGNAGKRDERVYKITGKQLSEIMSVSRYC